MTAEQLAKLFHETYEHLAPEFGYETRQESAVPWDEVAENHKNLMIAVCGKIIDQLSMSNFSSPTPGRGRPRGNS